MRAVPVRWVESCSAWKTADPRVRSFSHARPSLRLETYRGHLSTVVVYFNCKYSCIFIYLSINLSIFIFIHLLFFLVSCHHYLSTYLPLPYKVPSILSLCRFTLVQFIHSIATIDTPGSPVPSRLSMWVDCWRNCEPQPAQQSVQHAKPWCAWLLGKHSYSIVTNW